MIHTRLDCSADITIKFTSKQMHDHHACKDSLVDKLMKPVIFAMCKKTFDSSRMHHSHVQTCLTLLTPM